MHIFLSDLDAIPMLTERHKLPKNINDIASGIATGTFLSRTNLTYEKARAVAISPIEIKNKETLLFNKLVMTPTY